MIWGQEAGGCRSLGGFSWVLFVGCFFLGGGGLFGFLFPKYSVFLEGRMMANLALFCRLSSLGN